MHTTDTMNFNIIFFSYLLNGNNTEKRKNIDRGKDPAKKYESEGRIYTL